MNGQCPDLNGAKRGKEENMPEIPDEIKKRLFDANPILCCRMSDAMFYLGVAFLLVGIISDGINRVLLLEPTNWFIMAVTFFLLGIFAWFRGYFSARER